jgi:hypothetical protein
VRTAVGAEEVAKDAATRIFDIVHKARNEMEMEVENGLSRNRSDIHANVITLRFVSLIKKVLCPSQRRAEIVRFSSIHLKRSLDMALRNEKEMSVVDGTEGCDDEKLRRCEVDRRQAPRKDVAEGTRSLVLSSRSLRLAKELKEPFHPRLHVFKKQIFSIPYRTRKRQDTQYTGWENLTFLAFALASTKRLPLSLKER